mgnify:CR=1 FL=1
MFCVQRRSLLPVSRPEVAAGRGGSAAGVKAAAGLLTGLTAHAAHAAHAGLYAAGLGCGGYRFLVTRMEDGRSMAIFLECYQARRSVRTVLVLVALRVSNRCENAGSIDTGKLFDRFYRVDESRTGGQGFGLGLAIARSLVQGHRGTIGCTSDEGGTRFTVRLPLTRDQTSTEKKEKRG